MKIQTPILILAALVTTINRSCRKEGGTVFESVNKPLPAIASDKLKQSILVPSLDTPIPDGNSVIWNISFPLAWNQFNRDILHEPLQLQDDNGLSARMNGGTASADDLRPEDYYVAAGWGKENIVEKIRQEMAQKFPGEVVPAMNLQPEDLCSYAFMRVGIEFKRPYYQGSLNFVDSAGRKKWVSAFGIDDKYHRESDDKIREQIQVLYEDGRREKKMTEFVIDPDRNSRPYQVILAAMERQETLARTIAAVQGKIAGYQATEELGRLDFSEPLWIPDMLWKIAHDYQEIEGRYLANNGFTDYYIRAAYQDICFSLSWTGVAVKSQSNIMAAAAKAIFPRDFIFNQPFLLYIQKRDGGGPVFAMWVDNAELLGQIQSR